MCGLVKAHVNGAVMSVKEPLQYRPEGYSYVEEVAAWTRRYRYSSLLNITVGRVAFRDSSLF